MSLSPHESELFMVELYCDERRSSLDDNTDPGEFGVNNFNNWLDAQGEGQFDGTEEEFLALVAEAGFDPATNNWNGE
jgi:hypothetical protein